MTMSQFANDTAGLIDALGFKEPIDILGVSFGGFIAQEITLLHPKQVDKLMIYASDCSGKIAVPARIPSEPPPWNIKALFTLEFKDISLRNMLYI
jgi:pimeloyl-ACP methyl ester carboxylesterase